MTDSHGAAVTLCVALLAAVIAAAWAQGDANVTGRTSAATGPAHAGISPRRVTPCAHRPVTCLPLDRLERLALAAVRQGQAYGSCWGCASHWLRLLSLALIWRAFPPASRAWGQCVAIRESGANVAAVGPAGDYGLVQLHRPLWPVDYRRLLRDPGYAVRQFVLISDHGRRRSPWTGGVYGC
jgi:hypothetical protein